MVWQCWCEAELRRTPASSPNPNESESSHTCLKIEWKVWRLSSIHAYAFANFQQARLVVLSSYDYTISGYIMYILFLKAHWELPKGNVPYIHLYSVAVFRALFCRRNTGAVGNKVVVRKKSAKVQSFWNVCTTDGIKYHRPAGYVFRNRYPWNLFSKPISMNLAVRV